MPVLLGLPRLRCPPETQARPLLRLLHLRFSEVPTDSGRQPLPPVPRTGNPKQDVLTLTQAVARRLEYHVASHPEQWTVFQKRWPDEQSG